MKYRILLSVEPTRDDLPTNEVDLFVEVDGQIYRARKLYTEEEAKQVNIDVKKILIGQCFLEIGKSLVWSSSMR